MAEGIQAVYVLLSDEALLLTAVKEFDDEFNDEFDDEFEFDESIANCSIEYGVLHVTIFHGFHELAVNWLNYCIYQSM